MTTPLCVTWRTDDPCPVCGTGLHLTDQPPAGTRQDCALCGWSTTWNTTRKEAAHDPTHSR